MKNKFFLFIGSLFLTHAVLASTDSPMTFASYNIKNQADEDALLKDFNQLDHLDVIALQEVRTSQENNKNKFFQNLTKIWTHHCFLQVNESHDGTWESQAIFSRFPIEKCGSFALESSGIKKRRAQWALLKLNTPLQVLFVNTDHEVDRYLMLGYPDRLKQLRSLVKNLEFCEEAVGARCQALPTVVTGDFNSNGVSIASLFETQNEVDKMRRFFKKAGYDTALSCGSETDTFSSYFGDYELDHFFYKNIKLSCRRRLDGRKGSDHFPIWVQSEKHTPTS